MFGNLASLAVVSFLTVGTFATSLVTGNTHEHIISPLPKGSPSPTPLPTATPSPLPTDTPMPLPTATPSPTPPPITTSNDLETYFEKYSGQNNVDKELLKRIALCESGFNSNASYLDYKGMFQFSTESWTLTRQLMGESINPDLRTTPEEAIKTAAFKIAHNGASAWPNCH